MKTWSFKVKVGVYAAILTMAALIAGVCVMMLTLYFYQIREFDEELEEEAGELVWDLAMFKDSPKDPNLPLTDDLIPVTLRNHYLMVVGPAGGLVYKSPNLQSLTLGGDVGECRTETLFGNPCRVGTWRIDPYVVTVGARLNLVERFMKDLGVGFAAALPVVGLVVFFGGMLLGRRTVAPVAELSAAAERISASNPRERLPIPATQDEIAKLTEVLNRSFDRLQSSYEVATRFSADASHQLKTPIAILRAGIDHLLRDTELTPSQTSELALLLQQTRRLTSLIEDLLLLAQADAGRMFLEKKELDLKTLAQAAFDDLQVLVGDRNIAVEDGFQDIPSVLADRRLLGMVLQNLAENAAKYTPEGGTIRMSTFSEPGWVGVRISNTGEGISETDRKLIFERFRRGKDTGGGVRGHGLGLNIARELARAHGGDVALLSAEQSNIEFELRLPAVVGGEAGKI